MRHYATLLLSSALTLWPSAVTAHVEEPTQTRTQQQSECARLPSFAGISLQSRAKVSQLYRKVVVPFMIEDRRRRNELWSSYAPSTPKNNERSNGSRPNQAEQLEMFRQHQSELHEKEAEQTRLRADYNSWSSQAFANLRREESILVASLPISDRNGAEEVFAVHVPGFNGC